MKTDNYNRRETFRNEDELMALLSNYREPNKSK